MLFKKSIIKAYELLFNIKIWFYAKILSDNPPAGHLKIKSPVVFIGCGDIDFKGNDTQLGYYPSPHFYDCISHIEARNKDSHIEINGGCAINNNFSIIAEHGNIKIGSNVLIGLNFTCMNSNFHSLNPNNRGDENEIEWGDIIIGNNVFI